MNILVINGSPKGERSNTFKLTKAFLNGFRDNSEYNVDIVDISGAEINHCLGCFSCWNKTPGQCVIADDMHDLIEKYADSDLIIWSFPLYYFGMPSKMKAFLDRMLPINLPTLTVNENGTSGHVSRYDFSRQRHVLISTCGFYSIRGNYDALFRQFEIMFGDNLTKIVCPEGELFSVPQLELRTGEYLEYVEIAGVEYMSKGEISEKTQSKLSELLYPPEVFVKMANASWE